jgi:hypothetical protein
VNAALASWLSPAVEPIVLPYVYRYLVNEMAGLNVRMKLDIR